MKFTSNTPVVAPSVIGNARLRVSENPLAYGPTGKGMEGLAAGIGQVAKVAKDWQDDHDDAEYMEARNKIMGSLTESMYGENGLLTNGVGENAKGLVGRVNDTVKKTFDDVSKQYNRRVQARLRGTFNENAGNYERLAAQQEGREYVKQKDANYNAALALNADAIAASYDNPAIIDNMLKDSLQLMHYRAIDQGWSGQQLEVEKRAKLTSLVGGAIDNAISDGNLDQAESLLGRFRGGLSQEAVMKWEKTIRSENGIKASREVGEYVFQHYKDDPEGARNYIYNVLANETVGGGSGSGSYSGNAEIDSLLSQAESKYNLPPGLIAAVADAESSFDNDAESPAGALGIMQLMPDTAAGLGVDPYDKAGNIDGGAKYLRQLLDTFDGDIEKAVAAYNAGPNAVKSYGGIPPYAETQNYVRKVLGAIEGYSKIRGGGVSLDSLDSDIDAEGVDLTGTLPETIGMVNRANQIHKEMFGTPLWVSCTTGGHAAGTSHALGKKADVGSDALEESQQNRDAFDARLKAEGIGSVNEYDHPSEGSTAGHFDLNVTGYDWYNDTNHGGFKAGSGSGGHTRPKYTEKQLDDIWRQYNARVNDENAAEKAASNARVKGYINSLKDMTQTEAATYLERLRDEADYQEYKKVLTAVHDYFPEMFKKGSSGGSGSRSSRTYYTGVSGARFTANQIEDAKSDFEEYEERRKDKDETISRTDQRRYNKAARTLNDVQGNSGDNLASKEGLQLARHAVKVTTNDEEAEWYLIVHGKFSESEAKAYVEMVHGSEEED